MPPAGAPPYQWGVKPEDQYTRKRKAPLLDEMLVTFPDSKRLAPSTGNKYEDIVKYMKERHREQRQRLLDRHVQEFNEWKDETINSIDFEKTYKFHFPPTRPDAIMLPESINLISTPEAAAALQRLPASRRNVIISVGQFEMPQGLSEKDEYRLKQLSHPEFAAEIARQGVTIRDRMRREEQELRMYQNEAISIFFQALVRNHPEKYGKNGSNSKKEVPTAYKAPTFGPYNPLADKTGLGIEIRRPPPPPPLSIPKVPDPTSTGNTPRTGLFIPADNDIVMRDVSLATRLDIASPVLPSPGISRDPRKPPPPFDPYKLRVDHNPPPNLPPNPYKVRGEKSPRYTRYDVSQPSNTDPSGPYRRREDPYLSRRENIEPHTQTHRVAFSNKFKSPRSPSVRSPHNEHGAYQKSRHESDRTGEQSPGVGRNGSGRGASPGNSNIVDSGEAAYLRRSTMTRR